MSDDDDVAILIEGAKTFPDNMLFSMFIENVDRALAINNSGLFKVAGILADEIERRGLGNARLREYRELMRLAVTKADQKQ